MVSQEQQEAFMLKLMEQFFVSVLESVEYHKLNIKEIRENLNGRKGMKKNSFSRNFDLSFSLEFA